MNSLRVKDNDLYVIEVNDEGETIALSKSDISLPLKYRKCVDDIEKIIKKLEKLNFDDEKKTGEELFDDDEFFNEYKSLADCYDAMRKALDKFLGEGASQKIFGNHNWFSMFNDFFDAFEPHLIALGLSSEDSLKAAIEEKYSDKEEIL